MTAKKYTLKAPKIFSDKKFLFGINIFIFLISAALCLFGIYHHEAWFDEAQSYLIARDESVWDIIFSVPHYEGHPPLWHLVLKLVISLGVPYELTLQSVQFVTFITALFLVEFKSPFSLPVKALIPASYFFAYQYGVISRPYAMLMCFFLITAICYKKRFEKPFVYMLCLMFMCLCHSYGLAVAGGLIISDIIIMWTEVKKPSALVKKIISEKKLLVSYIILLATAIAIVLVIKPVDDTFASNTVPRYPFVFYYLCSWLFIPSECLFTAFLIEYKLQFVQVSAVQFITSAVISLVIWYFIFRLAKSRKKLITVFAVYAIVAVLPAVYAFSHHFGIFFIYLVFVLWICADEKKLSLDDICIKKDSSVWLRVQKTAFCIMVVISLGINLSWNEICFSTDYYESFYPGKEIAEIIKKNNLEDYNWIVSWDFYTPNANMYEGTAVTINPYFEKNIFSNMYENKTYFTHKNADKADYQEYIDKVKAMGKPDFILGDQEYINNIFIVLDLDKNEYQSVAFELGYHVVKNTPFPLTAQVYGRKDIIRNNKEN